LSDADLIRRAQQGDGAALQALYERYLPAVWRYAFLHSSGQRHLAEDIASETFLALVRQIGQLQPDGGPLGGWLLAVAKHKLSDARRRYRDEPLAAIEVADVTTPAAHRLQQRELVTRAIEQMKDDERLALEWKYVEALSVREIAARMGRTEKAVESILFRARNSFRTLVDRLGGTEPCRPTT